MIFIKASDFNSDFTHVRLFYIGQPDGNVFVKSPNCPSGENHVHNLYACYNNLIRENGDVDEMVPMVVHTKLYICYDQDTLEVFKDRVGSVRLFNSEYLLGEQPAVAVSSRAGMIRWMEETRRELLTAHGFLLLNNYVEPGPHPNAFVASNVTAATTLEQVYKLVCNRSMFSGSASVVSARAVPKKQEMLAYKLVDPGLHRTAPVAPVIAVRRTTKDLSGFGYKPTDTMLPRQRSVEYVDLTQDDDDEHSEPPSPKRTQGIEKQLRMGDGPSMGQRGLGRR